MKRLGLLAYSTQTGLGIQTYNYHKHLKPYKTMVVDLSPLNGAIQNPKLYKDAIHVLGIPTKKDCLDFVKDLDVLLVAETPLNYYLYEVARELEVKIVCVPNFEFNDHLVKDLPSPDLMLLPSVWYESRTRQLLKNKSIVVKYLPVPIDRDKLPFCAKTTAKRFVHIAGRKTFMDRNGTDIFLASIPLVKNPNVEFIIYSQQEMILPQDSRIRYMGEAKNVADMYSSNDALVLPRKYGGLCLPLNEALSCGLVPLMTDCSPQNYFLKDESLVSPFACTTIKTRTDIECYETTPQRLADAIDRLADLPTARVKELSLYSNYIADMWSWKSLMPQYKKVLYD